LLLRPSRHRLHLRLSLEQDADVYHGLPFISKRACDEVESLHIPFVGNGEEFDTIRFELVDLDSSSESATIFLFL
jgi:hypothetical protein